MPSFRPRLPRLRARDDLLRHQAFTDALVEALDTGIVVCDSAGTITHFTPAGATMHERTPVGMGPEDVASAYGVTLADGTPLQADALPMVRALAGTPVRDVEIVVTREGCSPRRLSINAQPVRAEHGEVIGAVVAQHDVTARSAAEAARREAELRFRTAFAGAPVGMALVALDGALLEVNDAFCRTLRTSAPELVGRQARTLAHPDDVDALAHVLGPDSRPVELRLRAGDGGDVWAQLSVSAVQDTDGRPLQYVAQVQDVTERRDFERRLSELALTDGLTGLWNRHRLQEEAERRLDHLRRHGGTGALLMLDLDGFKGINDTFGHAAGDAVLREVADRLRSRLRASDSAGRLGGDEFAVLVAEAGADEAAVVAHHVEQAITRWPLRVAGADVRLRVSVGVALIDGATASFDEALAAADRAMYAVKDHRYDRPGKHVAPDTDRLVLYAQPVAEAGTGRVCLHQVVVRLAADDAGRHAPPPGQPALERWVLAEALAAQAASARRGHQLDLAVPLSARTVADPGLPAHLDACLRATGADPARLLLAVGEPTVAAEEAALGDLVGLLRERGIRLVLDEAGTGFGSFPTLERLRVDVVKLSAEAAGPAGRALAEVAGTLGASAVEAVGAPVPLADLVAGVPARRPGQPVAPIRVLHCDDSDPYRALVRALLGPLEDIEVVGDTDGHAATVEAVQRLDPDVVLLDAVVRDTRPDIVKAIGAVKPQVRVVVLSGHDPAECVLAGDPRHWLRKTASADDLALAIRTAAG